MKWKNSLNLPNVGHGGGGTCQKNPRPSTPWIQWTPTEVHQTMETIFECSTYMHIVTYSRLNGILRLKSENWKTNSVEIALLRNFLRLQGVLGWASNQLSAKLCSNSHKITQNRAKSFKFVRNRSKLRDRIQKLSRALLLGGLGGGPGGFLQSGLKIRLFWRGSDKLSYQI